MRKACIGSALLLFCALQFAAAIPERDAANAFHAGRSGEILLTTDAWNEESAYIIIKDQVCEREYIKEVDIADLISHVSGRFLPVNDDVDRAGFPTSNLLSPPKASLLIAIPSTSSADLSHMTFLKTQRPTPVRSEAFPQDTIARLTTVLSGVTPASHGVMDHSWPSSAGIINAYASTSGQPLVANFPTLLSTSSAGKSLVLSASAVYQHAAALNAHLAVTKEHPLWNNVPIFWDGQEFATSASFGNLMTQVELFSTFTSRRPFITLPHGKVSYSTSQQSFQVTLEDGLSAAFNMKKPEDLSLFVELSFSFYLSDYAKKNEQVQSLVADDIPDYFSVSFSSLETLKKAHGADSDTVKVALALIDAAIERLSLSVAELYDGSLRTVIVGLPSKPSLELPASIAKILADSPIVEHYASYLPYVYMSHSASEKSKEALCAALEADRSLNVLCRFDHVLAKREDFGDWSDRGNANDTNTDDDDDDMIPFSSVAIFQILLWGSIVLGLVVLLAIYAVFSMEQGQDTLLFLSQPHGQHAQ